MRRSVKAFYALLLIGAAARPAVGAVVQEEWLACEQASECTSVELGCWYWQPVNGKYTAEIKAANTPDCRRSVASGPQPQPSCIDQHCANAPFTVDYWAHLENCQKAGLVGDRVNECLRSAHISPQLRRDVTLRESYLQAVEKTFQIKEFPPDIPLAKIIGLWIGCEDVVERATAFGKH
jgi:hypothetical protein